MILWAFKPVPNQNEFGVRIGVTHHRRVVALSTAAGHGKWHASLSTEWQYMRDGVWGGCQNYRTVTLSTHWALGSLHAYYDGPHCAFSLGFIHFSWQPDRCRKCEGDF